MVRFSLGCRCSWCLTAASHAVLHAHFGESPLSVGWRGLDAIILLAFCPNYPNTRECYYDCYFIMPCILGCRCRWCLTAASPRWHPVCSSFQLENHSTWSVAMLECILHTTSSIGHCRLQCLASTDAARLTSNIVMLTLVDNVFGATIVSSYISAVKEV